MIALAFAGGACTLPADDAGERPADEETVDVEPLLTSELDPVAYLDEAPAPEQTYSQCIAACEAGVAAMEVFCRFIVHPVVAKACWKAAYGGPTVCVNFCKWYFTP